LYCEIVDQASLHLSLHFFCQIKTQKTQIILDRIDEKYWSYWGEQPAPVFLVLVKYKKQDQLQENNEIWIYDVPYILSKRDAKKLGKRMLTRDVEEKFGSLIVPVEDSIYSGISQPGLQTADSLRGPEKFAGTDAAG
jgi:hypothetical protein